MTVLHGHNRLADSMSYERIAGVYEIRNTLNNKVYIGSSINVSKRLNAHRNHLKRGAHESIHLQASWNKYGPEAFQFAPLLVCAEKDILFYEQRIMDGYKANQREFGYNKRIVVETCAGMKLSNEHKAKIAAKVPRGPDHQYYGVGLCPKAYQVAADLKRGKPMPAEQRAKISASTKGKKKHPGFGAILSAARKGVPYSDQARRNMSLARTGMIQTREAKENKGKLNYEKVAELRKLASDGVGPHSKLADMFGVSRGRVSAILRGESWT